MQTRRGTQAEWDRRAGPARDSIFAELDPFGLPFADTVVARALLFPISRELEPGQIAALRETARALGDETIFLEVYERFASDRDRYWEFATDGGDPYDAVDVLGLESALFSPAGRWGMIVSQDDHALLGGSADFIEAIAARLPATKRPTENFLMGAQEPEWPEDGSLDDLVGALTAAGTRLPLSSGNPFGDSPVLAFVEFWKAMRDWSGRSNDWLAALVHHLFGEHEAERLLHESGW